MIPSLLLACTPPPEQAADAPAADVPAPVPSSGPVQPPTTSAPDAPVPVAPPDPGPMTSVPLLGGTLEPVPALGRLAFADPEGDRLVFAGGSPPVELALGEGSRPFRVEVDDGTVFVTLRGSGEVVRIDVAAAKVDWRVDACPEPRGLDHLPDDTLAVACAGGELLLLDAASGELRNRALVATDLRDVVATDGILYVSRFRAAEVLLVDPATLTVSDVAPLGSTGRVAWRMKALEDEGVLVLYDTVSSDTIDGAQDAYGGTSCDSLHLATFATVMPEGYAVPGVRLDGVVVATDFTVTDDGHVLVANGGTSPDLASVGVVDAGTLDEVMRDECRTPDDVVSVPPGGQPSSVVVFDGDVQVGTAGGSALLSEVPGGLTLPIWVGGDFPAAADAPFVVFHRDTGNGIACASCHPEGLDDGHVWTFGADVPDVSVPGPRKTMTLAGFPKARAPYHWVAELPTARDLVRSTMIDRMGGQWLPPSTVNELFDWLEGLRPVRATVETDEATLALGEMAFTFAGCAGCHVGEVATDNALAEVRPGEPAFKTPSLVGLGTRVSLMHDGCAATVDERLTGDEACTGGLMHGDLSVLTAQELEALAVYLRTL